MISVIGPAIVDVLVKPFRAEVFTKGTTAVDEANLSYGGNALNEAVVLGRLGADVELVTKLGRDEAGEQILRFAKASNVSTERFIMEAGLTTAINVVLVDEAGERYFLTNPDSNLRKLSYEDVEGYMDSLGDFVCFPCMFTSPLLDIPAMKKMFARIKEKSNRKLFLDMTTPKNGESLEDLKELFPYVDYFMPNEKELALLSGGKTMEQAAHRILEHGAECVIIKRGKEETAVFTREKEFFIPTYPDVKLVDSTGAGDSFGAGVIYGLETGMELKDAVRFGNAVASCAVEALGAAEGIASIDEPMHRYSILRQML